MSGVLGQAKELQQRHIGGNRSSDTKATTGIKSQKAMVIGVGAYGPDFCPLENATSDAAALAEVLTTEYGFMLIPEEGQTPLLDEQASLHTIRSTVVDGLNLAGASTRWLFYFAGHGTVAGDFGYLIPAGAVHGDCGTYLPLPWLLEQCRASQCGEIVIILDACYSGQALVRHEILDTEAPPDNEDRVRQVISSGNSRQPVLDGGGSGHSIFTQALLDGLEGWSGIHDERDGHVRFAALLDQLAYEVPIRLREQGLSPRLQQPVGGHFQSNTAGRQFVFEPRVKRLPPDIVRDMRSEDPARRTFSLTTLADKATPETLERAVELTVRHLQSDRYGSEFWAKRHKAVPLIGHTLRYEPTAEVRTQAAITLGKLAEQGSEGPLAIDALIAALRDVPSVCRAAAQSLGRLATPRAAAPLLKRLKVSDDSLFLDLVSAIGAIGNVDTTVEALREAARRGQLIPFVGPDFPEELTGLPDRLALARELQKREGLQVSDSLATTAAATLMGGSRYVFTDLIIRRMDSSLHNPGAIHRDLVSLNLPFWISGAYDGLLGEALGAQSIVSGEDTRYWEPGRTTVVRLAGDPTSPLSLVVLRQDYERLRGDERDRDRLVSWLRQEMQGKVVIFLGYDSNSPDLALLVETVLNRHLVDLGARAFLVWPVVGVHHTWSGNTIQLIQQESLAFVNHLAARLNEAEV